jgi:hypothetical protein
MGKVSIQITGGLGNQLFQFAAGLFLAEGNPERLEIEQKLGKPRGSSKAGADLFQFTWPKPLSVIEVEPNRVSDFMSRVTGYCLRMGVKPRILESKGAVRGSILFVASLLISVFLGRRKKIVAGKGVGFSELKSEISSPYLVGYFQSYRYAKANRNYLSKVSIKNVGSELAELNRAAIEELPLVVHLRFGDYLLEENFGIPSRDYYLDGVKSILAKDTCKSVWVFSDDLLMARDKLKLDESLPVRWIDSVDDSVVATLQAMRLGSGYVIANSTFSWWGAYLSLNPDAEVVAPSPWFMGMQDPEDLIPPNWKQLDARYQSRY